MPVWTPESFEADDGSFPFERFVDELSDFNAAALDAAVVRVLCALGIDLAKTEWLKALGDGLFEFRIRHTAEEIVARFGTQVPWTGRERRSRSCSGSSSISTVRRSCSCSAGTTRGGLRARSGSRPRSKRRGSS